MSLGVMDELGEFVEELLEQGYDKQAIVEGLRMAADTLEALDKMENEEETDGA